MNPSIIDFGNGESPSACNADDDQIKENINVNFNEDLFRNVDDVWEKENSKRQFYTLPNTSVPNQQVEFAKWLYQIPESLSCKTNGINCLKYNDGLRQRF